MRMRGMCLTHAYPTAWLGSGWARWTGPGRMGSRPGLPLTILTTIYLFYLYYVCFLIMRSGDFFTMTIIFYFK
jgi:hypothetical protein